VRLGRIQIDCAGCGWTTGAPIELDDDATDAYVPSLVDDWSRHMTRCRLIVTLIDP
jgi:hypothetical protein